ncbi:MAG: UDP-N-acetylglucosamine 2-epimerase [Planctomycetota bacterium]|nr:UDP-N-acetylglucosamine 2-epimerase [Planctomycetota bacterium]
MSAALAIYTSGRQDWGILLPVARALAARWPVAVIAGGLHRRAALPESLARWPPAALLDDLPANDSDPAIAAAAGRTLQGLAQALPAVGAQALLVVGDRLETLAAGVAATALRLPLIHLHGGETTLGAIDDRCRHALTRLAALHAVAHPSYRERLLAWGEPAERIVVSGAPALDALYAAALPDATTLARELGGPLGRPLVLVCLHPATLGADPAREAQAVREGVSAALAALPEARVLITRPNSDAGSAAIAAAWQAWAAADPRVLLAGDLGSERWWGLMAQASALVGNSSSALLEAPSFDLPVLNVGERQRGRLRVGRVWDAPDEPAAIAEALRAILARDEPLPRARRPSALGDGQAAARIAAAVADLLALPERERLRKAVA